MMVIVMKKKKNKEKRLIRSVTALCLTVLLLAGGSLSLPPLSALADSIWEPGNEFYWSHLGELVAVNEEYRTNDPSGSVTVYESPESDQVVAQLANDQWFLIGFTYTDAEGTQWGVIDLWGFEPGEGEILDSDVRDGWVPMDVMEAPYRESDFRQDHKEEFGEYQDELLGYQIKEQLLFWAYPGSGVIDVELYSGFNEENEPSYQWLYTDPVGYRWTYCGYYYGAKGWVCIDDPEGERLPRAEGLTLEENRLFAAAGEEMQPDSEGESPVETEKPAASTIPTADTDTAEPAATAVQATSGRAYLLGLVGIPILLLVVITGLLIAVFFRKGKDQS